jgi:hypothetical protein
MVLVHKQIPAFKTDVASNNPSLEISITLNITKPETVITLGVGWWHKTGIHITGANYPVLVLTQLHLMFAGSCVVSINGSYDIPVLSFSPPCPLLVV